MKTTLKERAKLADLTGGKVRIRLLSAGQGSSGHYAAPVLEEAANSFAYPAGSFLYLNHSKPASRDLRDAFGVLESNAEYDAETQALWANAEIFETHRAVIKELAPHAELSIEANGDVDESGEVTVILPDPFNAVALVPRGGRGGKITAILESAEYGTVVNNENQRKDAGMTPEDIQKIVEAMTAAFAAEFAKITEALKPVEPKEVATSDVAEALIAADLPKPARGRVFKALETGVDLAEAIQAESDYITEIKAEQAVNEGRVQNLGATEYDFSLNGWGR